MKLSTLKSNSRDGRVVLVDRDMKMAAAIADIGSTMQQLLDNWSAIEPALQERYESLNRGKLQGAEPFDVAKVAAPLPRAYQWCDGSAYLSHAELVRKARNAEMPDFLYQDPLMYQGASDTLSARPTTLRWPTKRGASTSKRRSSSSRMMCRWASARIRRPAISS